MTVKDFIKGMIGIDLSEYDIAEDLDLMERLNKEVDIELYDSSTILKIEKVSYSELFDEVLILLK